MTTIKLTRGKEALVDPDMYEELSKYKWNCLKIGYASRSVGGRGNKKIVYMHRFIVNASKGSYVDHINGDTLDNRRCNLRLCTQANNIANKRRHKNNTSGYTGVSRAKTKWSAQIMVNRKYKHLGNYATKEEAAEAYNKAAKEFFGEFARLNVIPLEGEKG